MSLSSSRQDGFGCVAKYCSAEKFWVSFGFGVSGILGVYQELIWRASLLQGSHDLEMDHCRWAPQWIAGPYVLVSALLVYLLVQVRHRNQIRTSLF